MLHLQPVKSLIFLSTFWFPCFIPCPADIVEKLLLAGYVADSVAGPLADGTEGGTALHLAAAQGWEEVRCLPFCAVLLLLLLLMPRWHTRTCAAAHTCWPFTSSAPQLPLGLCASCRWCTSCCSLLPTRGASTSRRATLSTLLCCTATPGCAPCCWMPAAGSQTAQVGLGTQLKSRLFAV